MRARGRNDVTLLAGLAIAALVIFQRPIWQFFQVGRDIEAQYGLALVPGLIILTVVFLGNILVGRIRSAAARRRAAERASTLALGQALSRATSMNGVHDVLRDQLPAAANATGAWLVTRTEGQWRALVGSSEGPGLGAITTIADRVLAEGTEMVDDTLGSTLDGHVCFRVTYGDSVAVLGVPVDAADDRENRQRLASIATLIAMAARNVQLLADIEENGVLDGLTGCFNRAHGMKVLDAELKRAKRARTFFSVVMFDLDYFKSVNDDYGHLCGDALLTAVGKRMQELLRNSDIKCRYGGEEFLILLPDTPLDGAVHVANVLREEIGKLSVSWTGKTVSTTASVGVAIADSGELDPKALIGRADAALYRAKHLCRNCVCVDGRADDDAQTDSGHDTASDQAVPTTERALVRGQVEGLGPERRGGRRPATLEGPPS